MAASAMEAAGGIDYLVRIAAGIIRKSPRHVTIIAPVVAYVFTFLSGTGHVFYPLLPVIYEVAMKGRVRPERPIAVATIASQQAITASPVSAATAALIAILGVAGNRPAADPHDLRAGDAAGRHRRRVDSDARRRRARPGSGVPAAARRRRNRTRPKVDGRIRAAAAAAACRSLGVDVSRRRCGRCLLRTLPRDATSRPGRCPPSPFRCP